MNSDEAFIFGVILGIIFMGLISLGLTFEHSTPRTVQAFEKLCKNGVQITCSTHGNYYLWDEKTKTSVELKTNAVISMANQIKDIK